jgi:acyl-CoA thioester hydrolase
MSAFRFHHPIEVRYGDLDPQGHLNNARYLTYFEQARVQYFIELGLFAKDQSFKEIGVILAEARVTFHAPVHFGTTVSVGVHTSKLGNKSMTVEQNILNSATSEVLASGQVVLVAFDYHTNETIPIPDYWREKIGQYEKGS